MHTLQHSVFMQYAHNSHNVCAPYLHVCFVMTGHRLREYDEPNGITYMSVNDLICSLVCGVMQYMDNTISTLFMVFAVKIVTVFFFFSFPLYASSSSLTVAARHAVLKPA